MMLKDTYEDTAPIGVVEMKRILESGQHTCFYQGMMNEYAVARLCSGCGRADVAFISMNHIMDWQQVREPRQ